MHKGIKRYWLELLDKAMVVCLGLNSSSNRLNNSVKFSNKSVGTQEPPKCRPKLSTSISSSSANRDFLL